MAAVNATFDIYGTTLKDSALLESEPPIDSRKSPQPREITPTAVKLGLAAARHACLVSKRLESRRWLRDPAQEPTPAT